MSEDDESNINDAVEGLESEVADSSTQNNNSKDKQPTTNSREDMDNNKKVKEILDKIKPYKKGDPVDLYLKSRGIKQYSYDCYTYENNGINYLVNVCYRTKYDKDNSSWNNEV